MSGTPTIDLAAADSRVRRRGSAFPQFAVDLANQQITKVVDTTAAPV